MKGIVTAIVLMWMTTASAAEIRCQDAPGREQKSNHLSAAEGDGSRRSPREPSVRPTRLAPV